MTRSARRAVAIAVLALVVIALVVGALAMGLPQPPAGSAPTTTPTPASTVVADPPLASPASPRPAADDRRRVYFVRSDHALPPVAVHADGIEMGGTTDGRIGSRLSTLTAMAPPAGLETAFPRDKSGPQVGGVKVEGDLVRVDFLLARGSWGIFGSSGSFLAMRQIVYTATEEPGIRRVLITQDGGKRAEFEGWDLSRPLTREDVSGYDRSGQPTERRGFGSRDGPVRAATTSWSVDEVAPGLARFVIAVDQRTVTPDRIHPDFRVRLEPNDEALRPDLGKWRLSIEVYAIDDRTTVNEWVLRTPLRVVSKVVDTVPGGTGATIYQLGLDDARPWRTALLFDPVRIVVDIGGHPSTVAPNTAVYGPRPNEEVAWDFSISGVASAFEAHVDWRVRGPNGTIIARYGTTGTNCCEPGGVFETVATVPRSVTGNATLEVFQASGADGSDMEVVRVPIVIRPIGAVGAAAMPHALFQPAGPPLLAEGEAFRLATYDRSGPFTYQARLTKYATLAQQQGIRTYQIDPQRDVWVVRVEQPLQAPIACRSFIKLIDASSRYDRGTLCGDDPWPLFR